MIVCLGDYARILEITENLLRDGSAVTLGHAIQLNIPFDTLSSLYSQFILRVADEKYHDLEKSKKYSTTGHLFKRVANGESLFALSRGHIIGEYKLAKVYLESVVRPATTIQSFMENPSVVANTVVRRDLLKMIASDPTNSVEANLIKECTGNDYEELLIDLLNARKMCFETEEESRAKGRPKTPDILFLIPMATKRTAQDPHENRLGVSTSMIEGTPRASPVKRSQSIDETSESYVVVNWIDSKAMCADIHTFRKHRQQLESYRNRYGRGMVIYWHGVVEDVFAELDDDFILVRDSFPTTWIFPTGEPADGREPEFDRIDLQGSVGAQQKEQPAQSESGDVARSLSSLFAAAAGEE